MCYNNDIMDIKKKILIVEDNKDLAAVYQSRLELEGFATTLVSDGEKALVTAIEVRPDLILLDVMMPEINGFDVLDILKNTDNTRNIKIILLTALSQLKDKDQAARLGADDYLVKSEADLDNIVSCIRNCIA